MEDVDGIWIRSRSDPDFLYGPVHTHYSNILSMSLEVVECLVRLPD